MSLKVWELKEVIKQADDDDLVMLKVSGVNWTANDAKVLYLKPTESERQRVLLLEE